MRKVKDCQGGVEVGQLGKTAAHRVRFQSPDAPPKQRRRLGDDPDVEESDDEPVELWVARGEDCCDACKQRNIRVCEPQWGAPRSSACKTCARKKQTCRSTRVWRNELANLFQCKPQPEGSLRDQAEVTEVPARPAGGAPAIQVDDAPQSVEGTVAGYRRAKGSNGSAPPVVDTNSRLSAIEASLAALNARLDRTDTDISAIKGHQEKQVESLAALERTQHDLKKMVLMLCGYHAVAAAPTAPSASTSSTAPHIVRSTNPSIYVGSSTSSTQSGRVGKHSFVFEVSYSFNFQRLNTVRRPGGNLGQSARIGLDCARRPN
ncbi:hypothetical protein EDB89DRAFT_2246885 [Lactarius sanguifluus]|nr:hypothetical protein EDB89DRAFT_2246885 [Lactarius sanguifluus]